MMDAVPNIPLQLFPKIEVTLWGFQLNGSTVIPRYIVKRERVRSRLTKYHVSMIFVSVKYRDRA